MTSQWTTWDTYAALRWFLAAGSSRLVHRGCSWRLLMAGDDEGPDRMIGPLVIDGVQRDVPMSGGGGGN